MRQNNLNDSTTGPYMDLLSDFGFKKLFGSEPNKPLLIDFLNQLFHGEKIITDLEYSPNEYLGVGEKERKVFFDLVCTGVKGEKFVVEMQRGYQKYFKERLVYYASTIIKEQLPKGPEGDNYELTEVYIICLLEFDLPKSDKSRYLYNICLMDRDIPEIFYEKLAYKLIELPNFVLKERELSTDLEKWLFILKHMSHLKKIPVYLRKPIFQRVFQIAEIGALTKEERMLYDASLKAKRDWDNTLAWVAEQAAERAAKEAVEKERAKAEQEKYDMQIESAKKMLKAGLSNSEIADFVSLPLEVIEKLKYAK